MLMPTKILAKYGDVWCGARLPLAPMAYFPIWVAASLKFDAIELMFT